MKTKLEFITHGAEVQRYHTVTTLRRETVGHHSHGVAMLCVLLCPSASAELLKAALMHDLAEQITGDIPSPAKREYYHGDNFDELERRLIGESGLKFPLLTDYEKRILKLADISHGALFCVRELELGNRRMGTVLQRYQQYAESMQLSLHELELFNTIAEMAK